MTIRVVIADDHRVVRDGLCYLLSQEPDVEVAGEAGDGGGQAAEVVAATRPDVLLLDLYMPGWTGTPCWPRCTTRRTGLPSSCSPPPPTMSTPSAPCTPERPPTCSRPPQPGKVIAAIRDAAVGTAHLSPELLTRLTRPSAGLRRPIRCSRSHRASAKYSG